MNYIWSVFSCALYNLNVVWLIQPNKYMYNWNHIMFEIGYFILALKLTDTCLKQWYFNVKFTRVHFNALWKTIYLLLVQNVHIWEENCRSREIFKFVFSFYQYM